MSNNTIQINGLILSEEERLAIGEAMRPILRQELEKILSQKKAKQYIPKRKAMKALGVTEPTIDAWHRKGVLIKEYIGGRVFYDAEKVEMLSVK
jgi:hypothetical protein